MKKAELIKKAESELSGNGFATVLAGNMHTLVDVLAERRGRKLMIKAVTNIDSVTQDEANELERLAWFLHAEPIVLGVCSKGGALRNNTSYNRFSLRCVSLSMLSMIASNRPGFVASKSLGSKVAVDSEKLARLRKLMGMGLSELSRKVSVSESMLYRHEHGCTYASSTTVTRLEGILHGSIRQDADSGASNAPKLHPARLANTRMQTLKLHFAPFDMVAKSKNYYEVSFDANERTLLKRAELFSAIRETFENNYPFFMSDRRSGKIKDVPVLNRRELMSSRSESELLDLIYS